MKELSKNMDAPSKSVPKTAHRPSSYHGSLPRPQNLPPTPHPPTGYHGTKQATQEKPRGRSASPSSAPRSSRSPPPHSSSPRGVETAAQPIKPSTPPGRLPTSPGPSSTPERRLGPPSEQAIRSTRKANPSSTPASGPPRRSLRLNPNP